MITDTTEILYRAWRGYSERFPKFFEAGHKEMRVAGAGIPVPLFNCAYPRRRVGPKEFGRLAADFSRLLAPTGVPGLLMARADRIEAPPGVEPVIRMPGMVAGELTASRYPAEKAELREVRDEKMAAEMARLNVMAHGMPAEEIEAMTCAALWEEPNHGFLLYVDGAAVASGSASLVDGISYVGWMATDAEYRGRGYAEAILRHMDAFMRRKYGVTEAVLHATAVGRPVYERVGYRIVDEILGYLCVPGGCELGT